MTDKILVLGSCLALAASMRGDLAASVVAMLIAVCASAAFEVVGDGRRKAALALVLAPLVLCALAPVACIVVPLSSYDAARLKTRWLAVVPPAFVACLGATCGLGLVTVCQLVVATLFSPETAPEFIDRFLVTCEAYKVPVTILLAKADLARTAPEAMAEFHDIYERAGYRVIDVSATGGEGVDEVRELLRGRTTLLSGNSGVGKSTLVAAVERTAEVRTGEISRSHHKGRHTTTFSTMYPLSEGGYIIDTPGIKGFGLIDIDDAELAHYFPEMMRWLPECRFYNCSHTHEPHCAVIEAVERGDIAVSRYESYLKILDEDDKYRK